MSHKTLKAAFYSVHKLFQKPLGLSFKSIADYRKDAKLMLTQLNAGGYQLFNIRHLKPRHIEYLVKQWQEENLSVRTIKNRISKIHFICKLIKKTNIIPKYDFSSDTITKLPALKYRAIHEIDINKIKNLYIRYSVRLQQEFGLRREESIKFIVSLADKGKYIQLKASWTKGGIERRIPIIKESQRNLLNEIKTFVGRGRSLIPNGSNYRKQENVYVSQVRAAGFKNLHGLRHAYAQKRYLELTTLMNGGNGWKCPANGGIPSASLTDWQKQIDYRARIIIASELGHSRPQITKIYCG